MAMSKNAPLDIFATRLSFRQDIFRAMRVKGERQRQHENTAKNA